MAVTDNIKRVRVGDADEAGIFTDVYVITNPAWNKRLAELQADFPDEFADEEWAGWNEGFWAAGFVRYIDAELSRLATKQGDYGYLWNCDVSDPKQGHKSDRYYFEVIWF